MGQNMGKRALLIDEVFRKVPGRRFFIPAVLGFVRKPIKYIILIGCFNNHTFLCQWKCNAKIHFAKLGYIAVITFFLFFKIIGRKCNDL